MLGLTSYKVELCCEVIGRLTIEGEPIRNQLIERGLTYDNEEVDSVHTDENGFFSMPSKSIKSRKPGKMFHEPVVRAVIVTRYQGILYKLWFSNQRGIKVSEQYRQLLSNLNCDLASEYKEYDFTYYDEDGREKIDTVKSICQWSKF